MILFFHPRQVLKNNLNWLCLAALIFTGGAVVLYIQTTAAGSRQGDEILTRLEGLAELLELVMSSGPLVGIALIFMNNFLSMAQMLLLGFLAGLAPLLTLALNGAALGLVLAMAAGEGGSPGAIFLLGILPHGLFELAAFFICGAMGLKFGYHCIASPLPGLNRPESFRHIWKEVIALLPLVVVLTLAAAILEILLTPILLERFL